MTEMQKRCVQFMLVFIFFSTFARENIIKVGSINSLCLILELFSRSPERAARAEAKLVWIMPSRK